MQFTNTATQLEASDRNSNRSRERERQKEAVYTACPHFYQAVSGSERVALMTREQLVKRDGEVGTFDQDSFRSDAMLWCEQLSFFKLKYCLDATMCTNSVLVHESFMSDGPYRMREDKRDLFHFNHLWVIVDLHVRCTQVCIILLEKKNWFPFKRSYLTNCLRKCVPKSSTWK